MSHYHLEIVMPPTEDIEAAVESIMAPYDENPSDSNEDHDTRHAFWDCYVIGGRFAGNKLMAGLDKQKIDEFYAWLQSENVTVSGFTCGKQELNPPSQRKKVDAKWNEMFPSPSGSAVACPIFNHSNDQYGRDGRGTIDGDVCELGAAMHVECSRVIFAGSSYDHKSKDGTGPLKAAFMLADTAWNGVNHMPVAWDGTIGHAREQFSKRLVHSSDDYRKAVEPHDDWITVTVDYHS